MGMFQFAHERIGEFSRQKREKPNMLQRFKLAIAELSAARRHSGKSSGGFPISVAKRGERDSRRIHQKITPQLEGGVSSNLAEARKTC